MVGSSKILLLMSAFCGIGSVISAFEIFLILVLVLEQL